MARILAVAGQKGGSGKSLVAVNLAAEGVRRGLRVLLVDADPQGSARTWQARGVELGAETPAVVAMDHTMHRPGQLDRLAAAVDLVVIDCPGRLGNVQASALGICDLAILPCAPDASDVWALAETAELVQDLQLRRPELRAAVLVNRLRAQTVLGRGAREAAESAGLPVLRAQLGDRAAYKRAFAAGAGVTTHAPRDPSADEIRALFDETYGGTHAKESRKALVRGAKQGRRAGAQDRGAERGAAHREEAPAGAARAGRVGPRGVGR